MADTTSETWMKSRRASGFFRAAARPCFTQCARCGRRNSLFCSGPYTLNIRRTTVRTPYFCEYIRHSCSARCLDLAYAVMGAGLWRSDAAPERFPYTPAVDGRIIMALRARHRSSAFRVPMMFTSVADRALRRNCDLRAAPARWMTMSTGPSKRIGFRTSRRQGMTRKFRFRR